MSNTITAPISSGMKGHPAASAILVSCVKNAKDTKTQHYDAEQIIAAIRSDAELRGSIEKIRQHFQAVMAATGSDRRAAKQAVDPAKKALPGVAWSGRFSRREKDALAE